MKSTAVTHARKTSSIPLGKCGCNCAACPTYKGDLKTMARRKYCSVGWEKYLGIKLSPEKLRLCDGCSIPDLERKTYYLNCKIRKCAMTNEVKNCAYCSGYPCEELKKAHSVQNIKSRDEFTRETGKDISKSEYKAFIEPYAGLLHLDAVRRTLHKGDIKQYKFFSLGTSFASLPAGAKSKGNAGKIIYSLLTALCCENNISYAHYQTLQTKREQCIKILWAMGLFGTFDHEGDHLELDAKTFSSQKIRCMYNTLLEYCNALKRYDVHCEIVPTVRRGWLTPMGGLRKEGWIFRCSFGEKLHGKDVLQAFREYVIKLNAKYGSRALRLFDAADISVMIN